MIEVNLKNGETLHIDPLTDLESLQHFCSLGSVSGLSFILPPSKLSLAFPAGFKDSPIFGCSLVYHKKTNELIGVSIWAQVYTVRNTCILYFRNMQIVSRLAFTGRMKYNPST